MISRELATKIRYIQIRTRKAVNNVMAGEYKSAFRGSGIEFDEVREYTPGDDVRSIDWNVTARQGRPFIKRFHEERELTVLFAVDLSASGHFGSGLQSKNELAAEFCALLSFSAARNNDKAGLLLFTDQVEKYIPPAKGTGHAMRLIREVLGFSPQSHGTCIADALDFLGKVLHRRAVIFLISDFQDKEYLQSLRRLARRHDVIIVSISDLREKEMPDVGLLELEDAETGEIQLINTADTSWRHSFCSLAQARQQEKNAEFRKLGLDTLDLSAGQDYRKQLVSFFRRRERSCR